VHDHLVAWLAGVTIGAITAIAVALATRFQLLPEVVDPSFILTGSGLGGLIGGAYAALRQYPAPRLARVVLLGGLGATAVFVVGVTGVL